MSWLTNPELVIQILRGICIAIYAPMLPVIFFLTWLEYKHPARYEKLSKWLR